MRVVVIGSGIVGAGAAYHLSRRGATVTVVDGGYQGEATQAGAGIVCPWVDHSEDEAWYRLTSEGTRHYPGLVEELGEDIGYAKVGALLVSEDPVDLEPVRALLRRRYAAAPEMGEIIDVPTPTEMFPPLSDRLSAILVPGAARVDGRSVRDALLRAAVAMGATVRTGVATLTPDGRVLLQPYVSGSASMPEASSQAGTELSSEYPARTSPEPAPDHQTQTSAAQAGEERTPEGQPQTGAGSNHQAQIGTGSEGRTPAGAGSEGHVQARAGADDPVQAGGQTPADREAGSWRQSAPLEPSASASAGATPAIAPPAEAGPRRFSGDPIPLDADAVIVAAGAWSGEVCRPLGVELPIFPRRGQILHVTLEGVDTAWWPIILPRTGPYLLGFPDSRVVIGATVEDVGFSSRVTLGGLEEVVEAGLQVAPGLVNATVSEVRVGLRPVYAPGSALIGHVTGRVVVATGLSAYGLTAGPFTGQIAAALALGETPPIDITPYAPPTP